MARVRRVGRLRSGCSRRVAARGASLLAARFAAGVFALPLSGLRIGALGRPTTNPDPAPVIPVDIARHAQTSASASASALRTVQQIGQVASPSLAQPDVGARIGSLAS